MNKMEMRELSEIVDRLAVLVKGLEDSSQMAYAETRVRGEDLVEINANAEGMIYIGSFALKMALSNIVNKQWQIDEHSLLDYCDKKLVLTLIDPPTAYVEP